MPKREQDELVCYPSSQHIAVMRNNHVYRVQVQDDSGLVVDRDALCSAFSTIINDVTPPPTHPISYLTGSDRDLWADVQQELMSNPQNARALHDIQSALFVVCLDDTIPSTDLDQVHSFLHNYGANRWFDKSFALIVSPDANIAVQPNHSGCDGWSVVNLSNKLYSNTVCPLKFNGSSPVVERITFDMSESLKLAVERAKYEVEKRCHSLAMKLLTYPHYGKIFLKDKGLKSHSTMHLAYALAHYRQHGSLGATMTITNTIMFRRGRTDRVHLVTAAVKDCAEALKDTSGASPSEKSMLLKKAVNQLSQLAKESRMGAGFVRHLFSLKTLSEQQSVTLPIFEDPAYAMLSNPPIAIVTLAGQSASGGAFGLIFPDGITSSYAINDGSIDIYSAALSDTRLADYSSNMLSVLDDIMRII